MAINDLIPDTEQAPENMELDLGEGTQVAGLLSKGLLSAVKSGQKTVNKKIKDDPGISISPIVPKKKSEEFKNKPKPPDVNLQNDSLIVPEASEKFTEKVKEAVEARKAEGNEQVKPTQVGRNETQVPKDTRVDAFNTTNYDGTLPSTINGVADALNIRPKKLTFDEIKIRAEKLDVTPEFIQKIIDGDKTIGGDPVLTRRALDVLNESANELDVLMNKAAGGQMTDIEKLKLRQQITLHSLISRGIKGIDTDRARAQAILRTRADQPRVVSELLSQTGDDMNLQDLARKYVSYTDPRQKAKLLNKTYKESFVDIWITTFINSILSGPQTHIKNVVGNSMFGILQMPERILASAIGKTLPDVMRRGESSPEGLEQSIEAWEEFAVNFATLRSTFEETLRRTVQVAKTNVSNDPYQKIEVAAGGGNPSVSDDIRNIFSQTFPEIDTNKDTLLGKGIDLYDFIVTAPGRALLAEDEMFKTFFYRQEVNRQIIRKSRAMYRRLIQKGKTELEAEKAITKYAQDLYENVPEDIDAAALSVARRSTFTEPLPETSLIPLLGGRAGTNTINLRSIERILGRTFFKPLVPFLRTPTNVMLETMDRVPLLQVLSPRFREDFAAGGVRRDLAYSKFGLSLLIGSYLVSLAQEGRITGYGPNQNQNRQAWKNTGATPYSLVLSKEEFDNMMDITKNYEDPELLITDMQGNERVSIADDKVYLSLNGYEPLSALMAVAADYAEYARYNPDEDEIFQMAMGFTLGIFNYMSEQPMVEGLAKLSSIIGQSQSGVQESKLASAGDQLAAMYFSTFIKGSPVGIASNSFMANIERYRDPEAKSYDFKNVIDEDTGKPLNFFLRNWYSALAEHNSRIPGLSNEDLPAQTNQWGEPILRGQGLAFETIFPTRVSPSQFSPADEVLWANNISIPELPMQIDGIKLSVTEHNMYKQLYSSTLINGVDVRTAIFLQAQRPSFYTEPQGSRENMMEAIHRTYMSAAQDLFRKARRDIANRANVLKQRKKYEGKRTKEFE